MLITSTTKSSVSSSLLLWSSSSSSSSRPSSLSRFLLFRRRCDNKRIVRHHITSCSAPVFQRRRMESSSSPPPLPSSFQAWRVDAVVADPTTDNGKPKYVGTEQTLTTDDSDDDGGDDKVWIRVTHSSLNYKDALSAAGNKGVTRTFPHTPGIDAAGTLLDGSGESALVTGYDLGMNTDGGFGEMIHVPRDWVVSPNPFDSDDREHNSEAARVSMVYGTAGLTAGLCVQKLLDVGRARPDDGPVIVTGSTGGVGSVAVEILAKLGFHVVAVTGKVDSHTDHLQKLGAAEVIGRDVVQPTSKPLLKPTYAHGVDTVGGSPLAELLKQIRPGGSVACCGNAAGLQLETTVLPFILRGVNLLGVDSVEIPLSDKKMVWDKLASVWRCPVTEAAARQIGRHELDGRLRAFLEGRSSGKIVLDHSLTMPRSSHL